TTATAFARVSVDDRELDLRLVGIEIEEELVHLIDDLLDPRVVPDDLVTTRITGRRDSSAFRGTKRVCGRGCGVRKRDRAADRGLSSVVIASLAQSHRVDCFRPSSLTRLVRRGAAVIRTCLQRRRLVGQTDASGFTGGFLLLLALTAFLARQLPGALHLRLDAAGHQSGRRLACGSSESIVTFIGLPSGAVGDAASLRRRRPSSDPLADQADARRLG